MVYRPLHFIFFPLHKWESQCPSAHTGGRKFPESFGECCSHIACLSCHEHELEQDMFTVSLAAPFPHKRCKMTQMPAKYQSGFKARNQALWIIDTWLAVFWQTRALLMCHIHSLLHIYSLLWLLYTYYIKLSPMVPFYFSYRVINIEIVCFLWGYIAKKKHHANFSSLSSLVPLALHEEIPGGVSTYVHFFTFQ